jgi:precorrin-2 dehydrogenase / sirohydrochlorin ferrochelatase
MLPLILNPANLRVALVGEGGAAFRRYQFLQASGTDKLSLFVGSHDGWACQSEASLYEGWPVTADLIGVAIVFVVGLPRELSEQMVDRAHRAGALVNVEDMPALCDFHVPAVVRRGDLLLTASTGGKAPGLASQIRAYLERLFGHEWVGRLHAISNARTQWRDDNLKPSEVSQRTQTMVEREGWLPEHCS